MLAGLRKNLLRLAQVCHRHLSLHRPERLPFFAVLKQFFYRVATEYEQLSEQVSAPPVDRPPGGRLLGRGLAESGGVITRRDTYCATAFPDFSPDPFPDYGPQ